MGSIITQFYHLDTQLLLCTFSFLQSNWVYYTERCRHMYSCCWQVGFNWIPRLFAISDQSFSRTKTVWVFAHFSFYIGCKETFM